VRSNKLFIFDTKNRKFALSQIFKGKSLLKSTALFKGEKNE